MSLLENVVANALQNLVGSYFYGVEKNKLKLSVLSGDLVLRNLQVRTDALSSLLLPFKVKWGLVREFRLNVPWKALGREAVRMTIDDVLVLVEPIKEWNHDEYLQMARKAKEEKVEAALLLEQKETQLKAASGFMDKLQQRVIDNVSITVRNVHLRYEDDFSNPERPFAAGITLEEFTAITCDSKWSVQAHDGNGPVYKLLEMRSVACYWSSVSDKGWFGDWFGDEDFGDESTARSPAPHPYPSAHPDAALPPQVARFRHMINSPVEVSSARDSGSGAYARREHYLLTPVLLRPPATASPCLRAQRLAAACR